MQVIGIDPSLSATGLATHDGLSTIKLNSKLGDSRLAEIRARVDVELWIADYRLAVLEDLPANAKSAGKTGMAQGVIREVLHAQGIPYITITPASLKKFATDDGRADKLKMREAWLRETGELNKDDNQVDAAYLREIGLHLAGVPSDITTYTSSAIEALRPTVEAMLSGFVFN